MGYCDCKYCKKFIGDCGNHFMDSYGHINFDIPSESVLDKFNNPTCFEETRTKYKELHDRMKEEGICKFCIIMQIHCIGYFNFTKNKEKGTFFVLRFGG